MDLSLTEEQQMLKTAARDFLKTECPWTLVKTVDSSENGFSSDLWKKISDMEWLAMPVPENYGGCGSCVTDLAVLYEEIGYALLPGPHFSSAVLCGSIIAALGREDQKKELLPAVARGQKILTLAFTEPDYGWGPECIHLSATRKDGAFVLSGIKRFVPDVQVADQLIVAARTRKDAGPEKGISLFLVDKQSPGISSRQLSGYTGEKLNEIVFNSVRVPESNLLGEIDNAWPALNRPLNRASLVLCAYMVGGCQHLLEMTRDYTQTRVQFGQPIGAFQWVQSYVIGQANWLEKARWLTWEAIFKVDCGKPQEEQDEAVSLAKAVSSEAFHGSSHYGHEVHAGLGVDKKYPLYLYSKKARTTYSLLGDPIYHRKRVARILGL
jgi:alkylation response protein AidB-like acyl-CoA dehydrogenase